MGLEVQDLGFHLNCSLNSLKGEYIGDYIVEYLTGSEWEC